MPAKIRLHELAKELGMTNAEAMDLAGALGVPVKSHSSSLNEAYSDMVRRRARLRMEGLPDAVRWAATALLDTQKDDRFKKLARFARRTMANGLLLNTTGVDPSQVRHLLRSSADLDLTWREQLVRAVASTAGDNVSAMATTAAVSPKSWV